MQSLRTMLAAAVVGAVALAPVRALAQAAPVLCDGRPATLVGTTGADTITGTPGPDVIAGLSGNDLLVGLAGDDVLCGDDGADVLEGDEGADRLLGGADETVQGEDGLHFGGGDTVRPGPGDDYVDLGEDGRRLEADPSVELLDYSGVTHGVIVDLGRGVAVAEGTDSLLVSGVHHVMATAYDDVLIGSGRRDFLCGGDGDDELRGLDGPDVLDADGFLGATCDLVPGPPSDAAGDDRLDGGLGRDVLVSRTGDDVLIGGSGRDQIGALRVDGRLVARGGAGGDFVSVRLDRGADPRVGAGAGRDELGISRSRAWRAQDTSTVMRLDLASGAFHASSRRAGSLRGFEDLTVGRGTRDPWRVRGTAGPNRLYLGYVLVPVTVLGRGGHDVVVGGHGDDHLDGGPGDDVVIGMAGRDRCLRGESLETCEERD